MYGSNLLDRLVKYLKERYGVGFSRSNVHYMRKLYVAFPNCTTLSCKLNWRHYVEIIKGDAPLEAGFYVILIKSCLFILFPKCVINTAFRKQNNIPYFLGQLIYVALYQRITHYILSRVNLYICLYVNMLVMQISKNNTPLIAIAICKSKVTYITTAFSYLYN